jgi:hypothetical protein
MRAKEFHSNGALLWGILDRLSDSLPIGDVPVLNNWQHSKAEKNSFLSIHRYD